MSTWSPLKFVESLPMAARVHLQHRLHLMPRERHPAAAHAAALALALALEGGPPTDAARRRLGELDGRLAGMVARGPAAGAGELADVAEVRALAARRLELAASLSYLERAAAGDAGAFEPPDDEARERAADVPLVRMALARDPAAGHARLVHDAGAAAAAARARAAQLDARELPQLAGRLAAGSIDLDEFRERAAARLAERDALAARAGRLEAAATAASEGLARRAAAAIREAGGPKAVAGGVAEARRMLGEFLPRRDAGLEALDAELAAVDAELGRLAPAGKAAPGRLATELATRGRDLAARRDAHRLEEERLSLAEVHDLVGRATAGRPAAVAELARLAAEVPAAFEAGLAVALAASWADSLVGAGPDAFGPLCRPDVRPEWLMPGR